MKERKTLIIESEVSSIDEAKELLADLEVLEKKYDVDFEITKSPKISIDEISPEYYPE